MPPKKDVFADLFPSANKNGSRRNAPLNESLNNSSGSVNGNKPSDPFSMFSSSSTTPNSTGNDPFDIFTSGVSAKGSPQNSLKPSVNPSVSRSANQSSTHLAASNVSDPFDVFNNSTSNSNSQTKRDVFPNSSMPSSRDRSHLEINLLDDEFTDAFEPVSVAAPVKSNAENSQAPSRKPRQPKQSIPIPKSSTTDSILAELVDIGFTVEDGNEAIAKRGNDLQSCVNYIMNKNAPPQDRIPERRQDDKANPVNFNDLGQDLYNKANKLFAFSKQTVMKNIQGMNNGGLLSGNSTGDRNLPAWMRDQELHKSQNLHKDESTKEYGSDTENLDHDEIQNYMRLQKQKDKEKAKQRLDNLKKTTLGGLKNLQKGGDQRETKEDLYERPQRESRSEVMPQRDNRSEVMPQRDSRSEAGPQRRQQASESRPVQRKQAPPSKSPEPAVNTPTQKLAATPQREKSPSIDLPEFDLLGLSSSSKSSIRDTTPLNQFDEVDYNTQKTTGQESFKNGDYATAMGCFETCLGKLPAAHENRVVIQSNLAIVYKLVGNLKSSLQSIEEGTSLIEDKEWNTENKIGDKSVKYWYIKLNITRAEVLELSERFDQSLQWYIVLIRDFGIVDKKIMDGKRRVDKIVNPDNHRVAKAKETPKNTTKAPSPPKPMPRSKADEPSGELDIRQLESIDAKIKQWSSSRGGEDNLRSLLTNLDEIIPAKIVMKPELRSLTSKELMLNKQVKLQYMKVISSIHPDKLASQCKGDKSTETLCNSVFIILNKAWEKFKTSS